MSPYSKHTSIKVLIISAFLVLFVWIFDCCNTIPERLASVNISAFGPDKLKLDMILSLSDNTNLQDHLDSIFHPSFPHSGETFVRFDCSVESVSSFSQKYRNKSYGELSKAIPNLKRGFPNEDALDSLNGVLSIKYNIWSTNKRFAIDAKELKDTLREYYHFPDSGWSVYACTTTFPSDNLYRVQSESLICFKDSLNLYHYKSSLHHNHSRFLFNDTIWSLRDVSQAYVGIKLKGRTTYFSERGFGPQNLFWQDDVKLTIDFGSPVSFSNISPEPDKVTMTSIIYTDKEKLMTISNDIGLVFFVKYLQNENIQSMKLFWISTIITALVTWLATIIYKWIRFLVNQRKEKEQGVNGKE